MNILVTFVLGFGAFVLANAKYVIQIAGIHIAVLLFWTTKGNHKISAISLLIHYFHFPYNFNYDRHMIHQFQ